MDSGQPLRGFRNDEREIVSELLDRIGEVISMLSEHPNAGRARPEIAPAVRSHPVGNYIVFYFPLSDGVETIRVLSGYQDVHAQDLE